MAWKLLSAFTIAVLSILLSIIDVSGNNTDFEDAKEAIIMRKIGHEILLHAGDSVSRVLPVDRLSDNKYQIQFESSFTFDPDSLVKIIHQAISDNQLSSSYIVNVVECSANKVIFGYAILGAKKTDIIPCSGRRQPIGCYFITLTFQNTSFTGVQKKYLTAGLSLLSLVLVFSGLSIFYKRKIDVTAKQKLQTGQHKYVPVGRFHFYNEDRCLVIDGKQIRLTIKESKLLSIFASNPNEVIDRNRLQKEIWEDEGVIVGRSLDMFVSKLRKKLENDPMVNLVNIHSKGYKLEINQARDQQL